MSMRVTFLGTSGAIPTTERAPSALVLNREGERFLFDCGEGTQRQMMRFGTGFTIAHIFVTHLHGDHILGIPGLVQTWDFNGRDDPLTIHAPRNTRSQLESLVHAGGYQPGYPIRINEVGPGSVALDGEDFEIRAFRTAHQTRSVGYVLAEDDRRGRFDREKAEALGVPVGPKFGKLHAGDPVELDDGRVVDPDEVVGDPRPGRCVVYTGDTRPVDETVAVAEDADLLVHDATFASDQASRARQTAHSTAREAADVAARAGVERLVLTHISSRYAGDASDHGHEARRAFDGDVVVAHDGQTVDVPFRDAE